MHGCAPGSGGRIGKANGMFKNGRYTQETKALRREVRQLAREGEVLAGASLRAFGGGKLKRRKRARRSDIAVEKALAAMLKAGQVTEVFSTVSDVMKGAKDVKPAPAAKPPGAT
jgi:hypothetical protein